VKANYIIIVRSLVNNMYSLS